MLAPAMLAKQQSSTYGERLAVLRAEARQFYLSLPGRYEQILAAARPQLKEVFRTWLQQDLPQDVFTVVKLAGFGLEDAKAQPVRWDISFETTGDKWLGIIIPFVGDTAQKATVDT